MKAFLPIIILAASVLPFGASAQYYGATSAPRPGVTVSANPYGVGVGVSSPYLNISYTTNGFYDCYGHHHCVSHKHKRNQHYCKQCEKEYRRMQKEMHKHHHHDNGNHNGWYKH